MAGPNLELFKFSLYLFFPLAIMIHYGDPQWYHDNVLPFRSKFWPDESLLYKPPRNAADLKSELEGLRMRRLEKKEKSDELKGWEAENVSRRAQGLSPLPLERTTALGTSAFTAQSQSSPSLRERGSLGSFKDSSSSKSKRTWRETWQEATERHVV